MDIVDLISWISIGFAGAFVIQLIALLVATRRQRVDIVDVAWGPSFVGVIAALHIAGSGFSPAVLLVDLLVIIWAVRLASHLMRRFLRSNQQDERYTNLMSKWPNKNRWLQIFTRIFMVQALLATIISLPVILIHINQPEISWLVAFGALIWSIGFIFESVADAQLKSFLAKSDGRKLMTSGLWRYSRHPNYFGEVTMWWGIALMAFAVPFGWLGLAGAATITILICFVSGVPPAEIQAARKDGWRSYKQNTSVIVPLPPKKI